MHETYRVWDKTKKKMWPKVILINFSDSYLLVEEDRALDFSDIVLLRGPGMKDLHKREIFQGDIVRSDRGLEYIKFERGAFRTNSLEEPNEFNPNVLGNVATERVYEIVGNIFEKGLFGESIHEV